MAAKIQVEPLGREVAAQAVPREFHVRVIEGASESSHRVTLTPGDYDRLTGGKIQPEELIRRSFEFLLAREPKESILARFNLMEIARYFPPFERAIKRAL